MNIILLVTDNSADISDAMKCSCLPIPIINGHPSLATIISLVFLSATAIA